MLKLRVTSPIATEPPKIQLNVIKPTVTLKVTSPQQAPHIQQNTQDFRITADDYQEHTLRSHIYAKTSSYVGSDQKVPRGERILEFASASNGTNKMVDAEITLPEAMDKCFTEISSNAGDNVEKSIRHGIDPGQIDVVVDRQWVTLRNGGVPIPVEINTKTGLYAPAMIFGRLLTSYNYDKQRKRTGAGTNGYGAKLVNIFSKIFTIEVADPYNGKLYKQTWKENMTVCEEPDIKPYPKTSPPYVMISYLLDFQRFGYEYYPDEAFKLYARHCADISFTCKVPTTFNGVLLNVQDIRDYAKLFLDPALVDNSVVHYQWPPNTEVVVKKGVYYAKDPRVIPELEFCAVDSPDEAISVSFANGMWTREGGVHVEATFKTLSKSILETINGVSGRVEVEGNQRLQKRLPKPMLNPSN